MRHVQRDMLDMNPESSRILCTVVSVQTSLKEFMEEALRYKARRRRHPPVWTGTSARYPESEKRERA